MMADTSQVRTRIARRSNGAIEKGSVGNLLDRLKPILDQNASGLPVHDLLGNQRI